MAISQYQKLFDDRITPVKPIDWDPIFKALAYRKSKEDDLTKSMSESAKALDTEALQRVNPGELSVDVPDYDVNLGIQKGFTNRINDIMKIAGENPYLADEQARRLAFDISTNQSTKLAAARKKSIDEQVKIAEQNENYRKDQDLFTSQALKNTEMAWNPNYIASKDVYIPKYIDLVKYRTDLKGSISNIDQPGAISWVDLPTTKQKVFVTYQDNFNNKYIKAPDPSGNYVFYNIDNVGNAKIAKNQNPGRLHSSLIDTYNTEHKESINTTQVTPNRVDDILNNTDLSDVIRYLEEKALKKVWIEGKKAGIINSNVLRDPAQENWLRTTAKEVAKDEFDKWRTGTMSSLTQANIQVSNMLKGAGNRGLGGFFKVSPKDPGRMSAYKTQQAFYGPTGLKPDELNNLREGLSDYRDSKNNNVRSAEDNTPNVTKLLNDASIVAWRDKKITAPDEHITTHNTDLNTVVRDMLQDMQARGFGQQLMSSAVSYKKDAEDSSKLVNSLADISGGNLASIKVDSVSFKTFPKSKYGERYIYADISVPINNSTVNISTIKGIIQEGDESGENTEIKVDKTISGKYLKLSNVRFAVYSKQINNIRQASANMLGDAILNEAQQSKSGSRSFPEPIRHLATSVITMYNDPRKMVAMKLVKDFNDIPVVMGNQVATISKHGGVYNIGGNNYASQSDAMLALYLRLYMPEYINKVPTVKGKLPDLTSGEE